MTVFTKNEFPWMGVSSWTNKTCLVLSECSVTGTEPAVIGNPGWVKVGGRRLYIIILYPEFPRAFHLKLSEPLTNTN